MGSESNMRKSSLKKWNFIPSLKGKHAERHVFILSTLAIKGFMSCWSLALERIKEKPEFGLWEPTTVYYERQKENSTIYKRLKFLESKKYVRKLGKTYKITAKGFFLIFALEPEIVRLLPDTFFNEPVMNINLKIKPAWLEQRDLSQNEIESYKGIFQDSFRNENLSIIIRRCLYSWKINMDEIDEAEFFRLIISKIQKDAKKRKAYFK